MAPNRRTLRYLYIHLVSVKVRSQQETKNSPHVTTQSDFLSLRGFLLGSSSPPPILPKPSKRRRESKSSKTRDSCKSLKIIGRTT
jgi:hypothetical protein